MFGCAGIKGIGCNRVSTGVQAKARRWHDHLIATAAVAHRAIARVGMQVCGRIDFKLNLAAMARPFVSQ